MPRSVCSFDGEAKILEEVFVKDRINNLIERNLHFVKLPASTSNIFQPADTSPIFKACKTHLRSMIAKVQVLSNPLVDGQILPSLQEIEREKKIPISADRKAKISYGCQAATAAIQEVQRPRLIQEGFYTSGHYPLSLEQMISQSTANITHNEYMAMLSSTPTDVKFVVDHGHLSEEQLDSSNIRAASGGKVQVPRDERPIQNQRAVWITHPSSMHDYQQYLNAGLPLGDVLVSRRLNQDEKKTLREAAKLIGGEEKRQRRSGRKLRERQG